MDYIVDPDAPELAPSHIDTGNSKTYEKISKEFYNELLKLYKNPRDYATEIENSNARKQAQQFDTGFITWSDTLSAIARIYVNEAGPCNHDISQANADIAKLVQQRLRFFKDAQVVTYQGDSQDTGKDLLIEMLKEENFNAAVKEEIYDELGVACSCNPLKGLQCMMIFGSGIKQGDISDAPDFLEVTGPLTCQQKCME